MKAQQLLMKPAQRKAANKASLTVSHLLAKHKKPFTNGELFKEAMAITAEIVLIELKSKNDIKTQLCAVPLYLATVTRRVKNTVRGCGLTGVKGPVPL